MTENEQLALMNKFEICQNPNVDEFGIHGCVMCPYRNQAYYEFLRDFHPDLFALCQQWRKWGSQSKIDKGEEEYFYFRKSKLMDSAQFDECLM